MLKRKLGNIVVTLLFMSLIFYVSYHAINGQRGLVAWIHLEKQWAETKDALDQVRAERVALEHKVNLLSENTLDLDLLDEQARKILGVARPEEKVYLIKK